jgi:hypothetical protein
MKKETNESIAEMSPLMYRNVMQEFEKYKNRNEMLLDKWAIKSKDGELVAVSFHVDELNKYEEKFINKLMQINNLNDSFIFEKYAVQKRLEKIGGKEQEIKTGWFLPIAFWSKFWEKYQWHKKNAEKIDSAIMNA